MLLTLGTIKIFRFYIQKPTHLWPFWAVTVLILTRVFRCFSNIRWQLYRTQNIQWITKQCIDNRTDFRLCPSRSDWAGDQPALRQRTTSDNWGFSWRTCRVDNWMLARLPAKRLNGEFIQTFDLKHGDGENIIEMCDALWVIVQWTLNSPCYLLYKRRIRIIYQLLIDNNNNSV